MLPVDFSMLFAVRGDVMMTTNAKSLGTQAVFVHEHAAPDLASLELN